jgi:hypothetical protein
MAKFQSIPVLAIVIGLSLPTALRAQNPPMNCTPDGIIEVCTLADTTAAPPAVEAVAPPAAPVPNVTYKNGQLTIIAENVPLSDVLREVSRKTGASLEIPSGSAAEPIFANIGPGSVRTVLVALLNGTKFNYVMLGSQDTSSDLRKIVLTPSDQPAEVAGSSEPDIPGQGVLPSESSRRALTAAASDQSPEERRATFMAQVEIARAAATQRNEEKFAKMMSSHRAGQTQDSDATESPAPEPAAPDSPQ